MNPGTTYFVLREGSTLEEQWSWEDIEALCRSGELSPRARVFLPDEDRWATLAETRLAEAFGEAHGESGAVAEENPNAQLEEEYKAAVERVALEPDALEAHLDAGVLAAQLGRREESRAHFQTVLHRHPYHSRAAQEVKRRFSRGELRSFRYLDRPAPAWDDLGELVAMPFARGPLYVVIPAAVLAGLSWVPMGGVAATVLLLLWIFQTMEYTARGANRPPDWNRSFADPWHKLIRPMLLMGAVLLQWALVIGGGAKLAMTAQRVTGESLWTFLSRSPVALVLTAIVAIVYLPAAFVSIGGFKGSVAQTLNPSRLVRSIARMEHEYVYTVALVAAVGIPIAILHAVVGGIPMAGPVLTGALLACGAPMVGLVLGRLLGRMGHVIE